MVNGSVLHACINFRVDIGVTYLEFNCCLYGSVVCLFVTSPGCTGKWEEDNDDVVCFLLGKRISYRLSGNGVTV